MLIQKAYMDFYMKKHVDCFTHIYEAIEALAQCPIKTDIFQIIIESGLDYIQKIHMTSS